MDELLTRDQVAELTGLTIETIKTYRRDKLMPDADRFFGRTPVWKMSTITAWRNKGEQK